MTPMWFSIDGDAVNDASSRLEWIGLLLITAAVAGLLFGMFWVAFGIIALAVDVGSWVNIALIVVAGGLGPALGAAVVLWLGIARRVTASRLRDLRTLSHTRGGVSLDQVTTMVGNRPAAERLLRRACELGVAAPAMR